LGLLFAACTPGPPPTIPPTAQAPISTVEPTVAACRQRRPGPDCRTRAAATNQYPRATPGLVEAALGNLSKTLHPYPTARRTPNPGSMPRP